MQNAFGWGLKGELDYGKGMEVTTGHGHTSERANSRHQDLSSGKKRIFEHPEAMTRLVVGLKSVTESSYGQRLEDLGNIVIVLYMHEGCFEEIATRRLGWKKDGSYLPPQLGCPHYHRNIRVRAPCCLQWVDCEKCHDELYTDHQMEPRNVTHVQCRTCQTKQKVQTPEQQQQRQRQQQQQSRGSDSNTNTNVNSNSNAGSSDDNSSHRSDTHTTTRGHRCGNRNCHRPFAILTCPRCKIWRDGTMESKGIQHCDRCDRCYPEEFFAYHNDLCTQSHAEHTSA